MMQRGFTSSARAWINFIWKGAEPVPEIEAQVTNFIKDIPLFDKVTGAVVQ